MSQQREQRGEEPLNRKHFRDWRGVVTTAARNAIPQDSWFHLENLQPIGPANAQTIPDISDELFDYGADTIYWARQLNLSGTDYIISFATNGKVFAYNIAADTSAQINGALTLLSGSASRMDQWKNQILLIIDSSGYYYWDGTTFAKITGAGVPSAGVDIAVAFGRVWIVNGRVLYYSGVDGFSNGVPAIPDATDYWAVANGAGFVNLTDPILRSNVTRLYAADGYLYYTGASSIHVISDVYVPTGATPPTPVFSNLPIQSNLGTGRPGSLFTFNRELTFANKTGIWAVYGVSAKRLSEDIDGTWQYADFSQPSFGGVVSINNITTRVMLMKRLNDPIFGNDTIMCMHWDNKWWFSNYGAITILIPVILDDVSTIFAYKGNKLYKLFSRTDRAGTSKFMTALWPMEDPLQDKQVIRAGVEVKMTSVTSQLQLSADTPNISIPLQNTAAFGSVSWINDSNSIIQWQNNALSVVTWFTGQFLLYSGSAPGGYGKYVGLSGSWQAQYTLQGCYMDYKLGAAW